MRPELNIKITSKQFLNFYWLKAELISFCRNIDISSSGGKQEMTDRITCFLDTGKVGKTVNSSKRTVSVKGFELALDSIINESYKSDQKHRAFFKRVIGDHFKFNTSFMNWMKVNIGKTYKDAVNEWQCLFKDKQAGKKLQIPSQFEYNQYTRDFFSANPGSCRADAIGCWKYKKSQPGINKYEDKDLAYINEQQF